MDDSEYAVGWICALPHELAASKAMLDEIHDSSPSPLLDDNNIYTRGKIQDHKVVIACLPAGNYGIGSAAISATHMKRSFPSIEFALLVGIGGAVLGSKHNIQLGDVVVSKPTQDHGGVIQYDMGKTLADGSFERRGYLNKPPKKLLNAINNLTAEYEMNGSNIPKHLQEAFEKFPRMRSTYSKPMKEASDSDPGSDSPSVHYGLIASGNRVISNTEARNGLTQSLDILCFEMEAAGLDDIPCLVIRGISDFADESKNDDWQRYAAITASGYAKELLITIQPLPALRRNIYEQDDSLGVASRLRTMLIHPNRTGAAISKDVREFNSEGDPKIFRIRNIPAGMDRLDLINLISSIERLSLSVMDIEILSIATNHTPYETVRTKIATARFNRLPKALQDGKNQWKFRAESRFNARSELILDTHFNGFTPLCDAMDDIAAVDCIAIAGVGHHPYECWSSSNSDFMYLRDQVAKEFPSFRVLLYGLETDVALYSSTEDISRLLAMDLKILRPASIASRPTIFLTHSLGGVMLKYSLVQMARSVDMEEFLDNIVAIMYFGVPTEAMEAADIVAMSKYIVPSGLIEALSGQNELKTLQDQFHGAALQRNIQSYLVYEVYPTNIAQLSSDDTWELSPQKKVLVPSHLAIPSSSEPSKIIPLKQHHHNLTRFEEDNTACYLVTNVLNTTSDTIQNTRKNASSHSSEAFGPNFSREKGITRTSTGSPIDALHSSLPQYDPARWADSVAYLRHLNDLMLRSLQFENDEQRYRQVANASSSTFEWAFSSEKCDLLSWLKSGTGAFWITGRPGSGKSTFMKFIIEHEVTERILDEHSKPRKLVTAQFFFHGRGSSLQRSFEGLLQSTILQMLRREPQLRQFVQPIFFRRRLTFWELWRFEELEEAFESICRNELSIKIFLFLDALDEYSGSKTIICDFIRKHSISSTNVCICFSSRPWTIFKERFQGITSIHMHERTQQDIAIFTAQMIENCPPLARLNSSRIEDQANGSQDLHQHIQSRACGVFLWVVLVLNVLEQRAIDGITYSAALKVLDELPDELDVFYKEIIDAIPAKYREEAYIIFETVLRSNPPINLELIQDALFLARAPTIQECLAAFSQDVSSRAQRVLRPGDSRTSDLVRIVSSRCGGLVECFTPSSYPRTQIQFMHHTVFEYFKVSAASQSLIDQISIRVLGTGHSILTKVHLAYLINNVDRPVTNWDHSFPIPQLISHAQAAERTTGLSQRAFLNSISESDWKAFPNIHHFRRNSSRIRKSFENVSSALVFAIFAHLELYVHEELTMFTNEERKQNISIRSTFMELLPALPIIFSHNHLKRLEMESYESQLRHFQISKLILDHFRLCYPDQNINHCLADCLYQGIVIIREIRRDRDVQLDSLVLPVVEALLVGGLDPNQSFQLDFSRCNPVQAENNPWPYAPENYTLIEWASQASTITVLHLAALHWHEGFLSLLLRHGADAKAKDSIGRTPLDWALAVLATNPGQEPHFYRCKFRVDNDGQINNGNDAPEDPILRKFFGDDVFLRLPGMGDFGHQIYDVAWDIWEPRRNQYLISSLPELVQAQNWRIVEIDRFDKRKISLLESHGAFISNSPDIHGQSPVYDDNLGGWRWPMTVQIKLTKPGQ